MATSRLLKRIVLAVAGLAAAMALSVAALIAWLDHHRSVRRAAASDRRGDAGAVCARVRPSLESIVGMLEQDPRHRAAGAGFHAPRAAADPCRRLADYRARLQAAGIAHGLSHYGDAVEFLVSTQGLAISGSGKSFVHAEHADPDATVIDGDLDAAVDALADKDVLLQRRIGEHWWLQLDRR